jgi:hypothetical protein
MCSLIFLLLCTAAAQTPSTMPTIEGQSFTDQKVVLPDAARGKAAVLIFGFTKASKDPTSAWAEKLSSDADTQTGLELYQLPVLEDVPRFIRGMLISGIKKGVRANRRAHFVPILQHERELKQFVHYKEPDDAYLVVLDSSGQVVLQRHGPFNDVAFTQLKKDIQSLLNRQSLNRQSLDHQR